jgi:hypothetical protein
VTQPPQCTVGYPRANELATPVALAEIIEAAANLT